MIHRGKKQSANLKFCYLSKEDSALKEDDNRFFFIREEWAQLGLLQMVIWAVFYSLNSKKK